MIKRREMDSYHRNLSGAITGGFVAGATLLVVLTNPIVAAAAFLSVAGGGALLGKNKLDDGLHAIEVDDFGYLLTDDELDELSRFIAASAEPTTPAARRSMEIAQAILAAEVEDEDIDDEDAPAVIDMHQSSDGGFASSDFPDASPAPLPADQVYSYVGNESEDFDTDADIDMESAQGPSEPTFNLGGRSYPLLVNGSPNPSLLSMPLRDRAIVILDALDSAGFTIKKYLNRPTFCAGTKQRSGKTALLVMMAIFEKAIHNRKIFYATADNDIYPFAFDGVAAGNPDNARSGFDAFCERVNSADVGSMIDETWVLDEFARTASGYDDQQRLNLWTMPLSGIAKTGGKFRGILHGTTASMCAVPSGWKETFAQEIVMARGGRELNESGVYQPTGIYEMYGDGDKDELKPMNECFSIPVWLLISVNESYYKTPCPVRSLLEFFPELDTRKGAIAGELLANTKPVSSPGEPSKPARKAEENTAATEEYSPSIEGCDPPVSPLSIPLSNSDKTIAWFLDSIARYMHKHPGKTRTGSSLLSICFSDVTKPVAKEHMQMLIETLAQQHSDSFEVVDCCGAIGLKCHTPKKSVGDYYGTR